MATRFHQPAAEFDRLAPMLRTIPSLPRAVLARLTERLLERLDELDGDPDLEPEEDWDPTGDDGCGPVRLMGRIYWGAEADADADEAAA